MIPKDLIKEGDHIVLKRDDNFWVMQVRVTRFVYIDKHKFTLDGVIGEPYGSKFQLKNESICRIDSSTASKLDIPDCGKGIDNRHIVGKDSNQQLSHEEILAMKKDGLTGDSIVGRLIENSSTFSLKTEYAQDKYIAKKKRKHMPVFIILRPSSRLLIEMYFAKSPGKICHLRPDSLAQILTHANVRAHSNVAVVDTCLGLVLGAVMERLGGFGNVIHIYHGQTPMRPVVDYYDFDRNHMNTLHSFPMEKLNLLKKTGNILIDYDKNNTGGVADDSSCKKMAKMGVDTSTKEGTETTAGSNTTTTANKESSCESSKCLETSEKTNDGGITSPVIGDGCKNDSETLPTKTSEPIVNVDENMETDTEVVVSTTDNQPNNQERSKDKSKEQVNGAKPEKKRFRGTFEDREAKREIELKKLAAAQEMLTTKKLDCIIVASKFYPTSLVLNLIRYLAPSRQLVVYSQYKEPLMECYAQLREVGGLVNFRVMESWCREFQVLNMRTHPLVNMSGTGGYILVATSVTKS